MTTIMTRIDLLMVLIDEDKKQDKYWSSLSNKIEFNKYFNVGITDAVEILVGDFFENLFIENVEDYIDDDETRKELKERILGWDADNEKKIMLDELEPMEKINVLAQLIRDRKTVYKDAKMFHDLGIHLESLEKEEFFNEPIETIIGHNDLFLQEFRFYDDLMTEDEFLTMVYQSWGFDKEISSAGEID